MLHDENKVLFHGQHENVTYGKIFVDGGIL